MLQWYLWPLRRKAPGISLTSLFLWDLNSTSRGVDSLDWIIILFSRWYLYWNSYHFEDYFSQCAEKKKVNWDMQALCYLHIFLHYFILWGNNLSFMELWSCKNRFNSKQVKVQQLEENCYEIADQRCTEDVCRPHVL